MDFRIRSMIDALIDLTNSYDDLPFEVRRLCFESVMRLVEKKADEAIVSEKRESDLVRDMEKNDAESISEN